MKPHRPARNAATATSLAAFRTSGAAPPARPAWRASPRHGNADSSGASKVRRPERSPGRGREPGTASRSGYVSAYRIGMPMSGMPSCARTERSTNSTIEWTIDCGCTTTSIRSNGTSNSQCASMTSRPLFISVAESIVIFAPICHVGCRRACSTVTPSSAGRGPPAERAARRRQHEAADLAGRRSRQALEERAVLGVDRQQRTPCSRAARVISAPAITSVSLLASAMVRPARIAASVGTRPAAPTSAETTTSAGTSAARVARPSAPASSSGRGERQLPRQAVHGGPVEQGHRAPAGAIADQLGDQRDVGAARGEAAHAELVREARRSGRGSDDRSIRSLRAR